MVDPDHEQTAAEIQSREQLRLTNLVANSILGGEAFTVVARKAVDEISRLIPACRVSLWLRTAKDLHSVVYSVSTVDFPPIQPGTAIAIGHKQRTLPPSAHVQVVDDVSAAQIELASRTEDERGWLAAEQREILRQVVEYVRAMGTRAFVRVPLVRTGKPLGAIALGAPLPRHWKPSEVALVKAVADALALARLKERAEQKREATSARLKIIAAVANAIAAGERVEEVARRALDQVVQLIADTRASYWVRQREGVFAAICSTCSTDSNSPSSREFNPEIAQAEGCEQALVIADSHSDETTHGMRAALDAFGARALIRMPLVWDSRPLGCLAIDAARPREWSSDEVAIAKELADTLATGLAKEEAERKRLEAEAALRASEEQFRLITENTSDLIAMVDSNGRRLYSSPSYRQLFGADVLQPGSDSSHRSIPKIAMR